MKSTKNRHLARMISKYELIGELGRGEMAAVYHARDTQTDVDVALKVMHREVAGNKDLVRRFYQEADILSMMSHPSLVDIYGIDYQSGVHFIAMEYFRGCQLQEVIDETQGIDCGTALLITRQLVEALVVAHSHKVIHRDIKPQNVMLNTKGEIRLMDFGIARLTADAKSSLVTQSGSLLGTPAFMSPEQCYGNQVDARSDVYSVGTLLYAMLAGQPPYQGQMLEIMFKIVSEPPPAIRKKRPDVTDGIVRILDACLQRDAALRYQSAAELLDEVNQALDALGFGIGFSDAVKHSIERNISDSRPLASLDSGDLPGEPGIPDGEAAEAEAGPNGGMSAPGTKPPRPAARRHSPPTTGARATGTQAAEAAAWGAAARTMAKRSSTAAARSADADSSSPADGTAPAVPAGREGPRENAPAEFAGKLRPARSPDSIRAGVAPDVWIEEVLASGFPDRAEATADTLGWADEFVGIIMG